MPALRLLPALPFAILLVANASAQEALPPPLPQLPLQEGQFVLEPSNNVELEILATPPKLQLDEALIEMQENVAEPQAVEAARSVLWKSLDPRDQAKAIDYLEKQNTPLASKMIWMQAQKPDASVDIKVLGFERLERLATAGDKGAQADQLNRTLTGFDTLQNFEMSKALFEKYQLGSANVPLSVKRDQATALQNGWWGDADLQSSADIWKYVTQMPGATHTDFTRYAKVQFEADGAKKASPEIFDALKKAAGSGDSTASIFAFDLARETNDKDALTQWRDVLTQQSTLAQDAAATLKLGELALQGDLGSPNAMQAFDLFVQSSAQKGQINAWSSARAAGRASQLYLDSVELGINPELQTQITMPEVRKLALEGAKEGDALALGQFGRILLQEGKPTLSYSTTVAAIESAPVADKQSLSQNLYKVCAEHLVAKCEPVPLFFITNRKPDSDVNVGFSSEAEGASTLHYGVAQVHIPTGETASNKERWYPTILYQVVKNSVFGQAQPLPDPPDLTSTDVTAMAGTTDRTLFMEALKSAVEAHRHKKVLIFIHGYNNSFVDGARRAALLAEQIKYPGVPVLFSWPSAGATLFAGRTDEDGLFPQWAYEADEIAVTESCATFVPALKEIVDSFGPENVTVVAHSMGNRLLNYMLSTCATEPSGTYHDIRLGKAIFASPDIDVGALAVGVLQYKEKVTSLTLYAMANDFALRSAENIMRRPQRAGIGGPRIAVIERISTVDATPVENQSPGNDPLNHSSFFDIPQVKQDLYELLRWTTDSTDRRCTVERKDDKTGRTYWWISPSCLS